MNRVYVLSFPSAQVLPGRVMFLLALAQLHHAESRIQTSQQVPIAVALWASMVILHGKGTSPKVNASPLQIARRTSPTQHLWPPTCVILTVSYVVLGNGLCLLICLETHIMTYMLCFCYLCQCKHVSRLQV